VFLVDHCRVTRCKRKMQRKIEQRYTIKLCDGLGKSGTETLSIIRQVFKDKSMAQATKKVRMSKSRVKVMLIISFDAKGVVHYKFLPEEQTINGVFYLEVLRRLKGRVNQMRPPIVGNYKLHNNASTDICSNFLLLQSRLSNTRLFLIPKVKSSINPSTSPWNPKCHQRSLHAYP